MGNQLETLEFTVVEHGRFRDHSGYRNKISVWVRGAWGMWHEYGRSVNMALVGKSEGRRNWEDLVIDGRMIL
jgi:hypothetical protein